LVLQHPEAKSQFMVWLEEGAPPPEEISPRQISQQNNALHILRIRGTARPSGRTLNFIADPGIDLLTSPSYSPLSWR
ncbi:hypothetical protein HPB47_001545, partial [Ixodes persulcatus]